MISICKAFTFEAAHHLPSHKGKCKHFHGHSYRLEVEVSGQQKAQGAEQGMIMDFGKLSKIINRKVLRYMDHNDLNVHYTTPTAENMVNDFALRLEKAFPKGVHLIRLRLWETATSYAEWRAD